MDVLLYRHTTKCAARHWMASVPLKCRWVYGSHTVHAYSTAQNISVYFFMSTWSVIVVANDMTVRNMRDCTQTNLCQGTKTDLFRSISFIVDFGSSGLFSVVTVKTHHCAFINLVSVTACVQCLSWVDDCHCKTNYAQTNLHNLAFSYSRRTLFIMTVIVNKLCTNKPS